MLRVLPPQPRSIDVASEIPMSGRASPLFRDVDLMMRQYLKWRCVGAGVLAISYRGRRVYKRGFGRTRGRASEERYEGCGDDVQNRYDPDAAVVPADAPMMLGSVAKPVTAAVARRLIQRRLAERPGVIPVECDEAPCEVPLTEVPLLHPELDLLPAGLAAILRGEEPVPVPQFDGPCVPGHDPTYADPRWRDITVANLISHQSGIPSADIPLSSGDASILANVSLLRRYRIVGGEGEDENAWRSEHEIVRALSPEYSDALDDATTWLSEQVGAPVYMVNLWNVRGGERPLDESIKIVAGKCLDYTPGEGGRYEQRGLYDDVGRVGSYSNTGLGVLGRVAAHLHGGPRGGHYTAAPGLPWEHDGSALQVFLDEALGITEGVESVEGIFARQFFDPPPEGYVHDYPIPRDWDGETYDPRSPDAKRPFCVWRGDHCSFDVWREGALKGKNVRPNWGFERTASGGFDDVEGWAAVFDPGPARGGLMAEAPALLRFANEFHMSGSSASPENYNGYPRGGDWRWSGGHIGSLPGARAAAFQIRGGTRVRELPPMVAGVLTDEFTARDTVIYELPDGVDFVAMVNQRGDSRCELQLGDVCDREYNALHDFLHYALSQVDWEAVEAMIAAESTTAVGMAIDRGGRTHVWFADDRRRSWLGRPDQDPGAPDEVDEVAAPGAPDGYRLPSTRIGQDVLGVAMNDADVVYAWYDDGRVSAGKPGDLAAIHGPVPFTIPEGFRREAIAAIAIADDGVVYTWFEDGRWLAGTATELGATAEGSFQTAVPGGVGAIQAIAFDRSTGRVWTRYRDQSVSEGTVEDLSAFAVHG